jgi:hypothetical protein
VPWGRIALLTIFHVSKKKWHFPKKSVFKIVCQASPLFFWGCRVARSPHHFVWVMMRHPGCLLIEHQGVHCFKDAGTFLLDWTISSWDVSFSDSGDVVW